MATVVDVNASVLISTASEDLKKVEQVQAPAWIDFVKTGAHKERPSEDPDFWFKRSASIMRILYVDGPVGLSKLRTKYGGKKARGSKTNKFYKGGGAIIRRILHQLESAGMVAKTPKGRVLTPAGKSFIDKIAARVARHGKEQASS